MYKILGGDGKEYGPISADTVRQWVNEGRANAETQVQPEGAGWIALGQLPEFAALFAAPAIPTIPAGAPSAFPAGAAPSGQAAQMVSGPAIGLMVTAGLGALAQLLSMVINILGAGAGMMGAAHDQQAAPAWANAMSGGLGVVFNVVGLIMSVVIFMGAMKMKKLESYNFALAGTIIAMVPCISPCCLVGLPIGIWALVILMKPEVKSAFQTGP
jgi:hypothetical protein